MVFKSYSEFRSSGMLTLINTILHIFGWAIVYQKDDDGHEAFIPARVLFRGFTEDSMTTMYKRLTQYMVTHANELKDEVDM